MSATTEYSPKIALRESFRAMSQLRNLYGKLESPLLWDFQMPTQNDGLDVIDEKSASPGQHGRRRSSLIHELAWQQLMQDVHIIDTVASAVCTRSTSSNSARPSAARKQVSWQDRSSDHIERTRHSASLPSVIAPAARGVAGADGKRAKGSESSIRNKLAPCGAAGVAQKPVQRATCTAGMAKALIGAVQGALGRR